MGQTGSWRPRPWDPIGGPGSASVGSSRKPGGASLQCGLAPWGGKPRTWRIGSRVSVRELSEALCPPCPTGPSRGWAKPVKTLGLGWAGLAWVTPAAGLLISRLKVRFLHGSPLGRGAATPHDSSFRSISCSPFQPRYRGLISAARSPERGASIGDKSSLSGQATCPAWGLGRHQDDRSWTAARASVSGRVVRSPSTYRRPCRGIHRAWKRKVVAGLACPIWAATYVMGAGGLSPGPARSRVANVCREPPDLLAHCR
jgi:hypothetical protein